MWEFMLATEVYGPQGACAGADSPPRARPQAAFDPEEALVYFDVDEGFMDVLGTCGPHWRTLTDNVGRNPHPTHTAHPYPTGPWLAVYPGLAQLSGFGACGGQRHAVAVRSDRAWREGPACVCQLVTLVPLPHSFLVRAVYT
jgi:hypothetical protein